MGRTDLIFVALLSLLGVYVQVDTFNDEVDILDVPYMAAIYQKKNGEEHVFQCHGVILDDSTILTTASCVVDTSAYSTIVRVGSSFADRGGRQVNGYEYTIHPQYDPDFDYDIAILRVYPEMVFSSRIAAVKLPEEDSLLDDIVNGNYTTWSFLTATTATVSKMGLNTMSNTSCSVSYQSSYPRKELFTDRMICTSPSRFLCSHRPGSPFIVNDTLYGLYSWTYRCDNPAVFTRVSAFVSWIDSGAPTEPTL